MPIKPNLMVNTCLLCGGELKRESPFYVCVDCDEKYDPDEVGFTLDMPANPYRGDQEQQQKRKGQSDEKHMTSKPAKRDA